MNINKIISSLVEEVKKEDMLFCLEDFGKWNDKGYSEIEAISGWWDIVLKFKLSGFLNVEVASVNMFSIRDKCSEIPIDEKMLFEIQNGFKNGVIDHFYSLEEERDRQEKEHEKEKKDYKGMQETYKSLSRIA